MTILIVSHRLSCAPLCDTVFVLENGRMVERGSHAELIERNGKYAELFEKQAEQYV
ncbi:hypothetical protein FACS1894105_07940 [Clostridia bacterium]|nr:hypothetical protein FACS1894105_07940 [Clostridia bacterium]